MKYILLISIIFSIIVYADFTKGLKFGISYNNIDRVNNEVPSSSDDGVSFGGFLKFNFNDYIFLNTEILYTEKGFFHGTIPYQGSTSFNTSRVFEYIEFPLLLGLQYKYIYAYGGIYYARYYGSYMSGNTSDTRSESGYYDGKVKPNDYGYITGFGVIIKNFLLDIRYSENLTDINYYKGEYSTDVKTLYQVIFSVGYKFD